MDIEEFWQLIEQARDDRTGDCDRTAVEVVRALSRLTAEEIRSFRNLLEDCLEDSNRWGLWGAADLINWGCGDDGFYYFRAWLISQGRRVFTNALHDPDSLADHPAMAGRDAYAPLECQGFLYAAHDAYQTVTGRELPLRSRSAKEPIGDRWTFDDERAMQEQYPRLWAVVRAPNPT
jgi:Protein of unknown function (DUF4240)